MNKLSAKHFSFFVIIVSIISFKTYSSLFISLGGRDTWIYTLLGFIIISLFISFIIYIILSTNTYNINTIFQKSFPKYISYFFLFLFCIGLFFSAIESTSVNANLIKTNFFPQTPTWYIVLFFLLPSFFLIGKKFKTLLIFIIITVSSLIVNTIIFSLLTESYKKNAYILPILDNGITKNSIISLILIIGSFSSIIIILPFFQFLDLKTKLKKHMFIVLCILTIFILYSILSTLSTLGSNYASNIFYPEFIQSQRINLAGFIEFGEFFFLFQSSLGLFIKYILCSFGIYLILKDKINNINLYIIIYSLIVFSISSILSKNNYMLFKVLTYYQISNIILFILVPLITFSLFKIRNSKK